MNSDEFFRLEYQTLREEIRDTKGRIYRTMGFGILVVPATNLLAKAFTVDSIILSLPILVVVIALVYLAENNSLMRCGRYVKHEIEPKINDIVGWETWLEVKSSWETRSVDKYLSYAFYLLFFVYFAGSMFLAGRYAFESYGAIPAGLLLGGYLAIGIWFVIFLLKTIRVSTTTDADVMDDTAP